MKYTERDLKLFWVKVDIREEDDCWNWTAGKTEFGHGHFHVGGKRGNCVIASRVSYELSNGEIPNGLYVLHKCDNPSCVNPKHLFLGTQQDNMDDMVSKGRSKRVDGNAKLSFEIAEQIRADKRPYSVLMNVYGVGKCTISYIKNNRIWKAEDRMAAAGA